MLSRRPRAQIPIAVDSVCRAQGCDGTDRPPAGGVSRYCQGPHKHCGVCDGWYSQATYDATNHVVECVEYVAANSPLGRNTPRNELAAASTQAGLSVDSIDAMRKIKDITAEAGYSYKIAADGAIASQCGTPHAPRVPAQVAQFILTHPNEKDKFNETFKYQGGTLREEATVYGNLANFATHSLLPDDVRLYFGSAFTKELTAAKADEPGRSVYDSWPCPSGRGAEDREERSLVETRRERERFHTVCVIMFKIIVLSIQVEGGVGGWRVVSPGPFIEQLNCNITEPMLLLALAMQRAYASKVIGGDNAETQAVALGEKRERERPCLLYCSYCFKSNHAAKNCRAQERKEPQGTLVEKNRAIAAFLPCQTIQIARAR